METQEQFVARMDSAQEVAFAKFCSEGRLAVLFATAPSPRHAEYVRAMLRAVYDAGVKFGVEKMLSELDAVTGTSL